VFAEDPPQFRYPDLFVAKEKDLISIRPPAPQLVL
jgi:hypothetical protein